MHCVWPRNVLPIKMTRNLLWLPDRQNILIVNRCISCPILLSWYVSGLESLSLPILVTCPQFFKKQKNCQQFINCLQHNSPYQLGSVPLSQPFCLQIPAVTWASYRNLANTHHTQIGQNVYTRRCTYCTININNFLFSPQVLGSLMLALITVRFPAYMERLSVTNLKQDNFLPILWLNASVIIQVNMKKEWATPIFIAMQY